MLQTLVSFLENRWLWQMIEEPARQTRTRPRFYQTHQKGHHTYQQKCTLIPKSELRIGSPSKRINGSILAFARYTQIGQRAGRSRLGSISVPCHLRQASPVSAERSPAWVDSAFRPEKKKKHLGGFRAIALLKPTKQNKKVFQPAPKTKSKFQRGSA